MLTRRVALRSNTQTQGRRQTERIQVHFPHFEMRCSMSKASKFSFIALHFVSFSEQTPSRVSHHQIRWIVPDAAAVKSPTKSSAVSEGTERGELSRPLATDGLRAGSARHIYACIVHRISMIENVTAAKTCTTHRRRRPSNIHIIYAQASDRDRC